MPILAAPTPRRPTCTGLQADEMPRARKGRGKPAVTAEVLTDYAEPEPAALLEAASAAALPAGRRGRQRQEVARVANLEGACVAS